MKIFTILNTTKGERLHIEEITDGEFVTSYGVDLGVPVDDNHPNGRETILRQSFVAPDQDETEEEMKEDIEQIYVQVDLYEREPNSYEREKFATWRVPLDVVLQAMLPPNEQRPNGTMCPHIEIEIKRFKMSTMDGK